MTRSLIMVNLKRLNVDIEAFLGVLGESDAEDVVQSYDESLPPTAKAQLEQALKHDNFEESILETILELERKYFDDDDCLLKYWMGYTSEQFSNNFRSWLKIWLISKGIELA